MGMVQRKQGRRKSIMIVEKDRTQGEVDKRTNEEVQGSNDASSKNDVVAKTGSNNDVSKAGSKTEANNISEKPASKTDAAADAPKEAPTMMQKMQEAKDKATAAVEEKTENAKQAIGIGTKEEENSEQKPGVKDETKHDEKEDEKSQSRTDEKHNNESSEKPDQRLNADKSEENALNKEVSDNMAAVAGPETTGNTKSPDKEMPQSTPDKSAGNRVEGARSDKSLDKKDGSSTGQ